MTFRILVGLDGRETGDHALAHAKKLAAAVGSSELILMYVIEWSPYSFQTPEENEMRHKRREEEITAAKTRIVDPAVTSLTADGFTASGMVQHGDVADLLMKTASEQKSDLIVVGRTSPGGFSQRVFGSATVSLAIHSKIPVTIVG